MHIFGKLLSRAFQKYIVSRAHHRSGKSYSELKLVISEITSYFISGTLHLIKKINEYITVRNNDGPACRLDFFCDSVRRLQTLVVSFREVVT